MNQANAMLTFGLLPAQEIVSIYTDENGDLVDPPEGRLIPLVKIPMPETGSWAPVLVWFDDRVERRWEAAQPPSPPPDWARLREAIRAHKGLKLAFRLALETDAIPAIAVVPRLDDAERDGNFVPFLDSLRDTLVALPPDNAQFAVRELARIGTECHMPQALVTALYHLRVYPDNADAVLLHG